jgi:YVTN family beta-propeller protein
MIRIAAANFTTRRLPVLALAVLLLSSCLPEQPNGIEGTGGVGTPPPATMITFLSPDCVPRGEQLLNPNTNGDLYVVGQNFQANSVVRWNGSDLPTTFFSSTQLTAKVSATDTATVGSAAVTVFTPGAGGGSSNTATFTINAGAVSPNSIAIDPVGQFAYVADGGCGNSTFGYVSMYSIDAITGSLTSVGPPVLTNDEGAISVAVSPAGTFIYVANWGAGDTAGSLSAYTINPTSGALAYTATIQAPCAPPPSPGSCAPWSVIVDPSGKFAYVANEGGFAPTSVSMYSIDATTGALTIIGTIAAAGRANSVAVDPTGKFVYLTNSQSDSVSMYTIDTTTGVLTPKGTIAAGSSPTALAIDRSGKFAYVTNSNSNDVSMYTINATTGALTSLGLMATGTAPASMAMDPSGKFAYVTNSGSNDVSMYSINASTGALLSIGTIPAGLFPSSIAIQPAGKFAYVTNSVSNSVSIYSIDVATGALTLIGTIGT